MLYYRGFLHYAAPQGDRIAKMKALVRGEAALDDDLNRFIRGNHRVIEHANLAATIPFCDWGLDYERGVGMLLPDLHHASQVLDLMIANARRLAAQQDPEAGIRQALLVHRMGRHIGNNVFISYLCALSGNKLANLAIIDILSDWQPTKTFLTDLRNQLNVIESQQNHLSASLEKVNRQTLSDLNVARKLTLPEMLVDWCDPNDHPGIYATCREADAEFFDRNRQYYLDHMAEVDLALALPFNQAYARLQFLQERLDRDRFTRDDAIAAASYCPSIATIYWVDIREQTFFNLMKTAVALYLATAETGSLPDALSPEMPKDLFTDKAFSYEKTQDGFQLGFTAIHPVIEKTYTYPFKVR
ncbi:MAG: hypothetical protein IH993_06760 [Proteobacteria bacterium]|nr:hypothetical protein [Pseudomonadota bacterium]